MSKQIRDLVDKIKKELEQKKLSREALLDQLVITDAEIDLIKEIYTPYDNQVVELSNNINITVNPIKEAYDARIASNCRTDLVWEDQGIQQYYAFIPELGYSQVNQRVWKVVKNSATASYTPYYGAKYYQKPLDRDYGTSIVGSFLGSIEYGSSVISVSQTGGIPNQIQIGDTITDSLTSPVVFSIGNLPEVVGIGTTQSVGIITTLMGGITTGSNEFHHFGSGSTSVVEVGMILSLPGILTTNTSITGFSSGTWPIEYINDAGILTSSSIETRILTLDNNALDYATDVDFTVGIITTYPAVFLSTSAYSTQTGLEFNALRITDDVDANFSYLTNPNSPITIGILNSNNLGVGHSLYLDNSGNPNIVSSWEPGKSYTDPTTGQIVNPEPSVGSGRVDYNIGTTQWPTRVSISTGAFPVAIATYAPEGTILKVAIGASSAVGTGYTNTPPGGFPPNCIDYDNQITIAIENNQNAINTNLPGINEGVAITRALRKEKTKKQMYAWSLLQGTSKLREEILEGEELIQQLDKLDI